MATTLILSKPELNPDVYFVNTGVTYWNFGTGWTFGINNVNGMGAEKLGVALSNLQLLVLDANELYTFTVLRPFTTYKWTARTEFVTNSGGGDSLTLVIGGVTIHTFAASGSFSIVTGTFTTGASGTVLFTSTAGNSTLISYLNLVESPTDYEIDLNEEVEVPLTLAINDIKDPAKRNASFSRTVTIPGTKNNNKFFNHIFEISGSGSFNPGKKVRALVINDGLLQLNGFCRLDHINRIENGLNNYSAVSYEITLFGELAELFMTIGDLLVSQLDFSEYDHAYTRANQKNSWYTSIIKNGSTYVNFDDGAFLTITSCQYNAGRVQMNFSGAHGLVANDWILIPINSITGAINVSHPKNYYTGEHMVYSVVSATEVVLQCPFYPAAGTIDTLTTGTNRVRKHTPKGEGYVYSMKDYDQNNGLYWDASHLYPDIYVPEIITKIAERFNFTFDSTLFDSTIFKKLVIPYNGGAFKLLNSEIENRLFQAQNTASQANTFLLSPYYQGPSIAANYKGHKIQGNPQPVIIDVAISNDSTNGNFDNGGVFNTGTFRYVPSASGIYTLNTSSFCLWSYTDIPGVQQVDVGGVNMLNQVGIVQLEIYNYSTNTVVTNCLIQHAPNPLPTSISGNDTPYLTTGEVDNLNLVAGQSYGVRFRVVTLPEKQFWYNPGVTQYASDIQINYGVYVGVVGAKAVFYNKVKNNNIQLGDTVYMNSVLPKMKCAEFLTNIIKMFNIYVDKDKTNDRRFIFETRDTFYSQGVEIDWTAKLDVSQQLKQSPIQSNAKISNYNYQEDNDFYNADHKALYGTVYGNRKRLLNNDFANGEHSTDLTFASTILADMQGFVVSNMQKGVDTNGAQEAFTGKARILLFNCSASATSSMYHTVVVGDFLEAISSNEVHQLYPYAGHLDKPDAPYFDLNFDYPKGVYFAYDSWTDRNLWNLYYKKAVLELTNKDSRLVTCYLHLTAYDIFKLDFRNIFVIDGHSLRLNKISDFLVGKNVPVLCEFLKMNDRPTFLSDEGGIQQAGRTVSGYTENQGFDNSLPFYAGEGNGSEQGNGNKVFVQGIGSKVGKGSYNVFVNGPGNIIGNNSYNMVISGYDNTVYPNLSNVFLINTNGVTVTESGKSYLNGQDVTNIQAKILRLST